MHTFVFIIDCIGDPACITYSFIMILLVALIELVVYLTDTPIAVGVFFQLFDSAVVSVVWDLL